MSEKNEKNIKKKPPSFRLELYGIEVTKDIIFYRLNRIRNGLQIKATGQWEVLEILLKNWFDLKYENSLPT